MHKTSWFRILLLSVSSVPSVAEFWGFIRVYLRLSAVAFGVCG